MLTQTKRYKVITEDLSKARQLSGLLNIISSNLLVVTQVLKHDYGIKVIQELELISRKARSIAKILLSTSNDLGKQDLQERISFIKHKLLALVNELTEELSKIDTDKNVSKKTLEDIILARRLLRESQRGLITIQD